MVENSQVPAMRCTKYVFLFIGSYLSCYYQVHLLSVTSKSVRSALEYSGLTKNKSSWVLGRASSLPQSGLVKSGEFKNGLRFKHLLVSHLTYGAKVVHNIIIQVRFKTPKLR